MEAWPDLLQYYMGGGQANLLQYYMGAGGSAETPKLYYVIYEQPLTYTFLLLFTPTLRAPTCNDRSWHRILVQLVIQLWIGIWAQIAQLFHFANG